MWRRWSFLRQFKLNLIRLIRLRAEPNDIAKGMALGLFIGMTPTMGIQMPIAVFFAALFKWRQKELAQQTSSLTRAFLEGLQPVSDLCRLHHWRRRSTAQITEVEPFDLPRTEPASADLDHLAPQGEMGLLGGLEFDQVTPGR